MELPAALAAALERELRGVARGDLAERALAVSTAYRGGGGSAPVIRDRQSALAYALTRAPATFAACARVMSELERVAPGFGPASLLDAGSGSGSASWAAAEAFPRLSQVTWAEANGPLLDLAIRLAAEARGALSSAKVLRGDLATAELPPADLVMASYVLAEIAAPRQATLVRALWAATRGVLALVEPGVPDGYARLLAARDGLIAGGATILAPCPHQAVCPLAPPDWCHFSVRLPRSRDHRLAKRAEASFEDEKFAYLLAARPQVAAIAPMPRILARPRETKPGLEFKLCTVGGLEHRFVPRREKLAHAAVRRLGWGDTLAGSAGP